MVTLPFGLYRKTNGVAGRGHFFSVAAHDAFGPDNAGRHGPADGARGAGSAHGEGTSALVEDARPQSAPTGDGGSGLIQCRRRNCHEAFGPWCQRTKITGKDIERSDLFRGHAM